MRGVGIADVLSSAPHAVTVFSAFGIRLDGLYSSPQQSMHARVTVATRD
ncbi:hypothetical protein KTS45_09505 [Halomicroarcula limicola]|uniref:Uncharacterized protein n=1 Tax=Haloarcula limicola TaxID=1429915 RepID=A0A8J7Y555_9EURY|nr:hypothetical protein [Halomicroarcula limicola]MBV0924437.1 hypothetical protein [Halomicroarcula limicola]